MTTLIQEELQKKLREIVREKGVALDVSDLYEDWDADEDTPDHQRYDGGFSYGSFEDHDAEDHIDPPFYRKDKQKPCSWVIPKGSPVQELFVSRFDGTFTENSHHELVVAWGCRCACGKFKNQPLHFKGSVSDVLKEIFKDEKSSLTL